MISWNVMTCHPLNAKVMTNRLNGATRHQIS
nr:MAG TPA: hypothetical protein [Caudoviricetes sp.]